MSIILNFQQLRIYFSIFEFMFLFRFPAMSNDCIWNTKQYKTMQNVFTPCSSTVHIVLYLYFKTWPYIISIDFRL